MKKGISRIQVGLAVAISAVVIVAGLYAAVPTANSCTKTSSNNPQLAYSGSTIKIGYLSELSGTGEDDGYSSLIGARLAVNQTNAAGGVDGGKSIQLIDLDTKTTPVVACQQAAVLDQKDGVLAITGPTDANDAAAIGQYAEASQVPFVASVIASAPLNSPNMKWTVAVEPDAVQQGAAVAKYVSEVVASPKVALVTQGAIEQTEMAAGARWFAQTYKNETLVYDQVYSNAQFPWATAAESVKISGANAVIVSWLPTVGFSESNIVQALLSVGFNQSQIFLSTITPNESDLGNGAAGMQGATLFDQQLVSQYPNASTFVSRVQPYISGQTSPRITACAPCLKEIGDDYYFGYVGMELIIASIQNATQGGQPLTRASFMTSLRQAHVPDLMGGTITADGSSSTQGRYQIAVVGALSAKGETYGLTLVKRVGFSQGLVPVESLAG